jgi:predicted lipoprotein
MKKNIDDIKQEKNPKIRVAKLIDKVGINNFNDYKNQVNLKKQGGKIISKRKLSLGSILGQSLPTIAQSLPSILGAIGNNNGNNSLNNIPKQSDPMTTITSLIGQLTPEQKEQLKTMLG